MTAKPVRVWNDPQPGSLLFSIRQIRGNNGIWQSSIRSPKDRFDCADPTTIQGRFPPLHASFDIVTGFPGTPTNGKCENEMGVSNLLPGTQCQPGWSGPSPLSGDRGSQADERCGLPAGSIRSGCTGSEFQRLAGFYERPTQQTGRNPLWEKTAMRSRPSIPTLEGQRDEPGLPAPGWLQ